MDPLYYRKIAELVLREGIGHDVYVVAMRALSRKRIKKPDQRILRTWMLDWCDRKEGRAKAEAEAAPVTSGRSSLKRALSSILWCR
jgi:hypothetical protein